MIKYVIPDGEKIRPINFWLIDKMKTKPLWFHENISIAACYGVIKNTIYEGGRYLEASKAKTDSDIRNIIKMYKQHDIQYRAVFTNLLLTEEMLNDFWGERQLQILTEMEGGVIFSTDLMKNHIIEKYNSLYKVSSVTRGRLDALERKELFEDKNIDLVVLNTYMNRCLKEGVPDEYKHKCEILANDLCDYSCPNGHFCYERISRKILGEDMDLSCMNPKRKRLERLKINYYDDYLWRKTNTPKITFEEVKEASEQGYEYFKLCGRNMNPTIQILEYADYFAKKEYREEFIINAILELQPALM